MVAQLMGDGAQELATTVAIPETPTVGLGRFIKENRFSVPSHQRDYSWDTPYVEQFLSDIEEAMSKGEQIYFCGLMVFTKAGTGPLRVLDGQQRLATTLMVFSAIRNWLAGYSDFKKSEVQIEGGYLKDDEFGATHPEPRLILNPANNDLFHRYVINGVPITEIERALKGLKKEDRNRTILGAALHVNRHILKLAASYPSPEAARDHFVNVVRFLTDTVQIVRFIVSGDEAAYTIFETLNDRGLELAPLDLVKNYLFSRAERLRVGGLRDVEKQWSDMMTVLGDVKPDAFLRAFWSSLHGKMEGTKLFREFKGTYKDPEAVHQIAADMRTGAERYAAIFKPNAAIWDGYPDRVRKSVDALATIGSSQMHPVVLAAVAKFDRHQLDMLLRLLEVIAVRYQLVARGRPGRIESLGGRAAREITDGKITTAAEVQAVLRELYTSDDAFRSQFAIKSESEGKKARYLLTVLERQALQRAGETFVDELVPGNVTLEHIYPKSPAEHWKAEAEADPELADRQLRLGNMCLLPEVNRALGNKRFAEKKVAFGKSRLRTTSSLTQYENWGSAEIDERQTHLADLAVAAWRFP